MKFMRTAIPDIITIEPDKPGSEPGLMLKPYGARPYIESLIPATFVQDDHLRLTHGALRGLHAQRRHPLGKLVRVIEGEIFGAAVDIRRGSPTFGQWVGTRASAENARQSYIPQGFAHGFCVLSETAQVAYQYTDYYDPSDEIHLLWNDPEIGIAWPVAYPQLSDADRSALLLRELMRWFPAYECALEVA
jgi:dTDP-4-dehydrorhamnose 3,5-epimerase